LVNGRSSASGDVVNLVRKSVRSWVHPASVSRRRLQLRYIAVSF
jgi:hypothetical protein